MPRHAVGAAAPRSRAGCQAALALPAQLASPLWGIPSGAAAKWERGALLPVGRSTAMGRSGHKKGEQHKD